MANPSGELMTKHWPADKVQRIPVAALLPNARNARLHSDEQVAQIAASIREWGFTIPILVDEHNVIIAGHGRVLAAKQLGLDDVPAMSAIGWTDAQKRAYMIADNKLTMNAKWDEQTLSAELIAIGLDMRHLVGFSVDELRGLSIGVTEAAFPDIPIGDRSDFRT